MHSRAPLIIQFRRDFVRQRNVWRKTGPDLKPVNPLRCLLDTMAASRGVATIDWSHADSLFGNRDGVIVPSPSGDADLFGQIYEIIRNNVDEGFRRPVDLRFRPEFERPGYVGRFESGCFRGFQIELVGRNHHDLAR
jgi:hypothetical protein